MKKTFFLCLLSLFMFSTNSNGLATTKEVVATGRYVMGDLDTKKDAKRLALLEAKQMALEKAGTYLSSVSEVKEEQLTRDEISSLAAGMISIEILEEKWTMEAENPVVTISIMARINTLQLAEQMKALREDDTRVEDYKEMRAELAALKQELNELKEKERLSTETDSEKKALENDLTKKKEDVLQQIDLIEVFEKSRWDLREGRLEKAISDLNKVISSDPSNISAYLNRAIALERMGWYSAAMEDLDQVLLLDPREWRAYSQKAQILLMRGKIEAAIWHFSTAIEINPKCAKCYRGRGIAHQKVRRFAKAYEDFRMACKLGLRGACETVRRMETRRRESARDRHPVRHPQPRKAY